MILISSFPPVIPVGKSRPIDSIITGRFTPAIGDSQTIYGSAVGKDAGLYQQAYRTYGDLRYARFLAGFDATGDNSFRSRAATPVRRGRCPSGWRPRRFPAWRGLTRAT